MESSRALLREGLAPWAEQDLVERPVTGFHILDCVKDRFGLQHHAGTAAERSIVDRAVRVRREGAEVDEFDSELSLRLRNPEDALLQVGPDGSWKERQNGAEHGAWPRRKGEGE